VAGDPAAAAAGERQWVEHQDGRLRLVHSGRFLTIPGRSLSRRIREPKNDD
jgi:hypothetical protein